MPTISVPQTLLRALMTKRGHTHDVGHVHEALPLLGTDIDRCDEESLDIEIFPEN